MSGVVQYCTAFYQTKTEFRLLNKRVPAELFLYFLEHPVYKHCRRRPFYPKIGNITGEKEGESGVNKKCVVTKKSLYMSCNSNIQCIIHSIQSRLLHAKHSLEIPLSVRPSIRPPVIHNTKILRRLSFVGAFFLFTAEHLFVYS